MIWVFDMTILIINFCVLGLGILFLGRKITGTCEEISSKTGISHFFLGAVLLSAVTSLPECVTSLSALLHVQSAPMAIGDLIGSVMLNLTFLAGIMLFLKETATLAHLRKTDEQLSVLCFGMITVIILGAVALPKGIALGWVGFESIILAVFYTVGMYRLNMKSTASVANSIGHSNRSAMWLLFSLQLVALSILSWLLALLGDSIAQKANMSHSFVGAFFFWQLPQACRK